MTNTPIKTSEHQAYPLNRDIVAGEKVEAPTANEVKPKDKGAKTPGAFPCSICDYIARTEQGSKVHITRSHPKEETKEEIKEEIKNEKETKESKTPEKEEIKEKIETPEVKDEVKKGE